MKKELGGNILKFLFFAACGYGIIRASIWSYFQTQLFFSPFDAQSGNAIVSNSLALIFQYGQNVALFLAAIESGRRIAYSNKILSIPGNKAHIAILEEEINKSQNTSNIFYFLFVLFALVDGGTNLGEFFQSTLPDAQASLTGLALTLFIAVGCLVSVVVIFVEELFMSTANAVLHALNDIFESLGWKRVPSLDLFIDPDKILATKLGERGGGKQQPQFPSGDRGGGDRGSGNMGMPSRPPQERERYPMPQRSSSPDPRLAEDSLMPLSAQMPRTQGAREMLGKQLGSQVKKRN